MKKGNAAVFIVYLQFGAHKERASEHMDEHVAWLRGGLDDGVFLFGGSLPNRRGGVLLAYGLTQDALERRLDGDPFVRHGVVTVEVIPVAVGMTQEGAEFLTAARTTP